MRSANINLVVLCRQYFYSITLRLKVVKPIFSKHSFVRIKRTNATILPVSILAGLQG